MDFEFAPLLQELRRVHEGVACGGTEHLLYNLVVDVGRANVGTVIASVAILSWMTFRDRNDKRVFMQNLRSWYLMSGSAQTHIWSMSLQIVPHLFRTYSRT